MSSENDWRKILVTFLGKVTEKILEKWQEIGLLWEATDSSTTLRMTEKVIGMTDYKVTPRLHSLLRFISLGTDH